MRAGPGRTRWGMEAFVVLLVPLVAAVIYLSARFQAAGNPVSPEEELTQLQERLAWHEDRLRRAKEKNWDNTMIGQIAAQLAEAQGRLARVTAAQPTASRRNQGR